MTQEELGSAQKYICVQGSQSVLRHCTAALPEMHPGLQGIQER